jgi:hypothetical protein
LALPRGDPDPNPGEGDDVGVVFLSPPSPRPNARDTSVFAPLPRLANWPRETVGESTLPAGLPNRSALPPLLPPGRESLPKTMPLPFGLAGAEEAPLGCDDMRCPCPNGLGLGLDRLPGGDADRSRSLPPTPRPRLSDSHGLRGRPVGVAVVFALPRPRIVIPLPTEAV